MEMENSTLIFILIGVLSVAEIALFLLVFDVRKKVNDILGGGGAGTLEGAIRSQQDKFQTMEHDIIGIRAQTEELRKMAEPAIQKVGIVRFNPFENVGGDHSFAIALLNSKNDGIVLSGLYLREGARVYSKPVEDGKSQYQLSEEEKQALEKAMRGEA